MDALFYDGPLACDKNDSMGDWYAIVKVEHEGVAEMRWSGNSGSFYSSDRVSDACVEGPLYQMQALAAAIKTRDDLDFKRCAVSFEGDFAYFSSPRNSSRPGMVPLARADELADAILALEPTP